MTGQKQLVSSPNKQLDSIHFARRKTQPVARRKTDFTRSFTYQHLNYLLRFFFAVMKASPGFHLCTTHILTLTKTPYPNEQQQNP